MSRYDESEQLNVRDALALLTLDDLKPVAKLVGTPPARKGELVDLIARTLENMEKVRSLYDKLDDSGKKAVQEATYDPEGVLDEARFAAKYGRSPDFGGSGRRFNNDGQPSLLRLFFPRSNVLPIDLRQMLRTFVPEPEPLTAKSNDELPAKVQRPHVDHGPYHAKPDKTEVEMEVRLTARAALHDVKAVLRLIDAGGVKVSDKKHRPSQAAMNAVAGVLADGDFYTERNANDDDWEPDTDLNIQPFAWPMLVQAAGLVEAAGSRLQLTAAGRKATTSPAHEVIRQIWQRWQKTTLLDEFNRIEVIKGQQSKGRGLSAIAPRRQAVIEVLQKCPAGKWLSTEEVFRLLKVQAPRMRVTHDAWQLYIAEQRYGSLGYDGEYTWETLEGRYVLAFLFEYAATLGVIDVAYISPEGARNDFHDRWGTDELSCLSRYDGLLFVRINPLGAWCLGISETFIPETVPNERVLTVLANRDVVASDRPPSTADVLYLERFAERRSDKVWQLSTEKILQAVEKGLSLKELREFLEAKSSEPLPQTVDVFLADLEDKTSQLEDLGAARIIACKNVVVAQTLASDRRLRKLVYLAGERHIAFRSADETAVRRGLRELGYVVPPT
jgi:hypothetical protein